jgi:23S rRNA (pseudouridine1915-N3)-methyltransferase
MFNFTVVSVGKLKSAPIHTLVKDYQSRLKRTGKIESIILSDGTVESEGQRMLGLINKRPSAKVFVLSEEGPGMSSVQLARTVKDLQGQHALFIIGGAYGLSEAVKASADQLLSLSPMTFTHEMAALVLTEQLYRAVSINNGSKYHHS